MKDLQTFKKIYSYRKDGYNVTETSYLLNISIDTVKKYWYINETEIEKK